MGTAQLIIVIGSLVILGMFGLMISQSMSTRSDWNMYNQALITATSLGQSLIEQIRLESFDEKTVGATVIVPDSLTAIGLLGPDLGEIPPTSCDDLDDFNNYTQKDSLGTLGVFNSKVHVYYVVKLNGDTPSSTRTFSKRVDVMVTNAFLTDTCRVSCVFTY